MTWLSSGAAAAISSAWRTRIFFSVLFTAAAAKFFLVLNLPTEILTNAGHDDTLFMRLGSEIASGHWLGAFNQFTLMKGPGYPLFLAATSLSGLPLSATQALFQIAAISGAAWLAFRLTRSRAFAASVFVVLMFCPVGLAVSRVIREQIYWAQSILVFSLAGIVLFAPPRRRTHAMALAGLTGMIFGWTWLTREEGVWFVPGIALLGAGAVVIARNNKEELRALARNVCLAALGFLAVNAIFRTGNFAAYRSFVGVDFREHNFASAVEALEDINAGPIVPHVPVTSSMRSEAAKVSPTFAPLNVLFYPQRGLAGYMSPGCQIYKDTCGDYAGGWFVWALRDAGAANGFYASPKAASENFGEIADEIGAACSDGRLRCSRRWIAYMPRLNAQQWRALPGTVATLAALIAVPPRVPLYGTSSSNGANDTVFEAYWRFLNRPRIVRALAGESEITVRGWYYDSNSTEWPAYKAFSRSGDEISTDVIRQASPDLQKYFSDDRAENDRFTLTFHCPDRCDILARTSGSADLRLTLDRDLQLSTAAASARLYIDSVSGIKMLADTGGALAARARDSLIGLYRAVAPILLLAGLLVFVVASADAVRKRVLRPLLVVALAAWVLVATRIILLALIDVSSFPAINIAYASPASYLAIMAAFLSIAAFTWDSWKSGSDRA